MRILIKGAGDLATGIAYRLKRCGHDILMTETAIPTTVRRTVSFSRAVYEGTSVVEGMEAVLVNDITEAEEMIATNRIPVIVDEAASIRRAFEPDVVVDAIIAKKNLGTEISDAGLVIGVGPGFTAGIDCDCVIETKRGHYLGRVIYDGSAIPNTGVPGMIAGYSVERIIRANAEGEFEPVRQIGDSVVEGDLVARAGGVDIYAKMPGLIRGMLQAGVHVVPGMKCGDIDARAEIEHCYTISDKARAIGGGVLEAIDRYTRRLENIGIVLLAAGEGRRYGSNKLVASYNGRPMFNYCVDAASEALGLSGMSLGRGGSVIVTGYDEVARYATMRGFMPVINRKPEQGISLSLKMGLRELEHKDAILFAVCDQPGVTADTFRRLISGYAAGDKGLACLGQGKNKLGNPCIFSRQYFRELLRLEGDSGGKRVIMKHMDDLIIVPADDRELNDVDYIEPL